MSQGSSRKPLNAIACDLIIERCLIHGLPHIVDKKKSLWIRIFWSFLLFISLGLYFYFLYLISFKFFINPDISLNFRHRPMREFPFPAVTICSPVMSDDFNRNFSDLMAISQWCDIKASLEALNSTKELRSQNLIQNIKNSQQKLDEFMFNCTYKTIPINCSKLFSRVLTEFGYCFTYNMQDHHAIFNEEISKDFDGYKKEEKGKIQWTLDGGYSTHKEIVFPRRAKRSEQLEINFKLQTRSQDHLCTGFSNSFMIFFHLTNEIIFHNKPSFDLLHFVKYTEISAKSSAISNEVKNYPPNVRKCYLDGEKKLKFFKQYTENMCRLECLTNITSKECKCVKFSMPRDDDTRICVNYEEVKCMIEAEKKWISGGTSCECLSTCNYVNYFIKSDRTHELHEFIDDNGKNLNYIESMNFSRIRLKISDNEIEEEIKVCSYDFKSYLVELAGLNSLFTGCSIISLLELAFFIIERRRRQRGEETTQTSSLDEFVQSSSIEGAKCFHSSESKYVKIFWILTFFLSFCGLGFYIFEIYSKLNLKPIISLEIGEIPMQEIPFPAVTICSPRFSRKLSPRTFLKNPGGVIFTAEEKSDLAANLQACSPRLASIFAIALHSSSKNISSILRSKISSHYAFFDACGFQMTRTNCIKMFNYVLTDYGFCFTFNLEGFSTLFNTEVISDDFKCYKRDKLAKHYNPYHKEYSKFIDDSNQTVDWTLEQGYFSKDFDVLPVRASFQNRIITEIGIFSAKYMCPELGQRFSFFLHMPNEILTPFHRGYHCNFDLHFYLDVKHFKINQNLRPYPPSERGCYFEGEKSLKFFKTYTKAHCDFECLANFTLDACECVKFSMPRENSTPICGINQTSCYVEAMRSWSSKDSSKCDCLHSCIYIEYGTEFLIDSKISISNVSTEFTLIPKSIFAQKFVKTSSYSLTSGLADFGGMLGVFFGASVISFIEIFYFCFIALIKKNFNIQMENSGSLANSTGPSNIQKSSQIADESTFHAIQFIFRANLHKLIRGFWIITFTAMLCFGIYNTRINFHKLIIKPQTHIKQNQIAIEEIPFPAISICSPLFVRGNLTYPAIIFNKLFLNNRSSIKILNNEEYKYLIANNLWYTSYMATDYISARNSFVLNASDPDNLHSNDDLVPYLNRSHFEIDEYFHICEIGGKRTDCKKIFRRILTVNGICYSFNMQSFHTIFNEEISNNFDSYGRYEEKQDPQWSLDQGYQVPNPKNPIPASVNNDLFLILKIPMDEFKKTSLTYQRFFLHLPNEIFTTTSKVHNLNFNHEKIVALSATTLRSSENLRRFKPENRGCYFQNERKLQFFNTYTKSNCEFECLTNLTLQNLNCTPFFYPHNEATRICSSALEVYYFDNILTSFPPLNDSAAPCGCLPNCVNIEYKLEDLYHKKKSFFIENSTDEFSISHFRLKFTEPKYIESEVIVTYNTLNFIADVGGLLGLFLGCSMLSFFELIYYPTKFIIDKIKIRKQKVKIHARQLDIGILLNISNQLAQVSNLKEEECENCVELNENNGESQCSNEKVKNQENNEKTESSENEKEQNFNRSELVEEGANSSERKVIKYFFDSLKILN